MPRPELCHNTLTPARTLRLHKNVVMCSVHVWGLCWAMMYSLHNGIHPLEMEIRSMKTACGCPCDGIIKHRGIILISNGYARLCYPLTQCICQCTVALCIRWLTVSAEERYNNTIRRCERCSTENGCMLQVSYYSTQHGCKLQVSYYSIKPQCKTKEKQPLVWHITVQDPWFLLVW